MCGPMFFLVEVVFVHFVMSLNNVMFGISARLVGFCSNRRQEAGYADWTGGGD